jgi:hypothetical protein
MREPTTREIAQGRRRLAQELRLDPEHLVYRGVMLPAPGMPGLMMFNVCLEGHPQNKSTLSVRMP